MPNKPFSERLLAWFDRHGRKDLPWQRERNPYRVWVSEIMLQQTQVATVIPYFERFMARFPTVAALARAEEDEVLHLWTGLGYYARARNLHKAAKHIHEALGGVFPGSVEALAELPGIGPSTAGAIIAQAEDRRAVILDGNVKRVLCRHHCVEGWPEQSATLKRLWRLADELTPASRCADYTQAIMDLGATVCTRSRPACALCPVQEDCRASREGRTADFPQRKPKKALPVRRTVMLLLQDPTGQRVLLEKRPGQGIWGGLWSFPELPEEQDPNDFLLARGLGEAGHSERWDDLRHTFSHFHLDIRPLRVRLKRPEPRIMENTGWHWYDLHQPPALGLAAPVQRLLELLREGREPPFAPSPRA